MNATERKYSKRSLKKYYYSGKAVVTSSFRIGFFLWNIFLNVQDRGGFFPFFYIHFFPSFFFSFPTWKDSSALTVKITKDSLSPWNYTNYITGFIFIGRGGTLNGCGAFEFSILCGGYLQSISVFRIFGSFITFHYGF